MKQHQKKIRIAAALAVMTSLLTLAQQAQASIVSYSDRAAFTAASTSLTNIDFEGIAPTGGYSDYSDPSGLTLSGVNFVGTGSSWPNYLFVIDSGYHAAYNYGSGDTLFGEMGGYITATLPSNVTAVGFDFMALYGGHAGAPVNFTFTTSSGQSFTGTSSTRPNESFFGITSDSAITSVLIEPTLRNDYTLIDNFTFGQTAATAPVPEPETYAMMGMGLLMLIGMARRKKLHDQKPQATPLLS